MVRIYGQPSIKRYLIQVCGIIKCVLLELLHMKKTPTIVSVILVVVILALATWIFWRSGYFSESQNKAPSIIPTVSNHQTSTKPINYRTNDLNALSVPEKNSPDVPADIAKPDVVAPARPGSVSDNRGYEVSIGQGKMTPPTIIVRQNDTIHINFTSLDQAYKVAQPDYGLKATVPAGGSSVMEFSASASGKYSFLCKECAGVNDTTLGYLLVTPQ